MQTLSRWLIQHPISFGFATLVISCIVSIYAEPLRRFIAISPQRLSVWVLKARIDAAVSRLEQIKRYRQDFSLMFLYFMRVVLLVLSSLVLIAVLIDTDITRAGKPSVFRTITWILTISLSQTFLFRAYLTYKYLAWPGHFSRRLYAKVTRLKERLDAKTELTNTAQASD